MKPPGRSAVARATSTSSLSRATMACSLEANGLWRAAMAISKALLDHRPRTLAQCIDVRAGKAVQRPVDHQHGKAMDGRPSEELRAKSAFLREHVGRDHPVERHAQELERVEAGGASLGWIGWGWPLVRHREDRAKQAGFGQSEMQVPEADGAQARPRQLRGAERRAQGADLRFH